MERYGVWVDLGGYWMSGPRLASAKAARVRALDVAGKLAARVYVVDHVASVVRLAVALELVARAVAS